jgi:hypothetical protein
MAMVRIPNTGILTCILPVPTHLQYEVEFGSPEVVLGLWNGYGEAVLQALHEKPNPTPGHDKAPELFSFQKF